MIPIIIYLTGYFLVYIILKVYRNISKQNTWSDVFATIVISAFSWIGLIIIAVISLIPLMENLKDKKPPKWL